MKQKTPIGSRKWREVTDFDLKVLSVVIIILSLVTLTLVLYTFYLKMQKSKVEVVIKDIDAGTNPPTEKTIQTATQTVIIVEPAKEPTPVVLLPQETQEMKSAKVYMEESTNTVEISPLLQATKTELKSQETKEATENIKKAEESNPIVEENKYLKGLTKFDYNLLVSRMAENLPESALKSLYVYVVDGETALKVAKLTQNYIIDKAGGGKYYVITLTNVMPELNPTKGLYTVKTDPISSSKDAFKSVVNLRTVGISAFSISTKSGYIICMGIFTSESQAKNSYYSQDWTELTRYGHVSGAKVARIGG